MRTISATTMGRDEISRRRFAGAWRAGIAFVAVVLTTLAMPVRPASADVTFNQRILELVNRERSANGLNPLVSDPTMSATAEDAPYLGCGFTVAGRAKDMGDRNYFSHTILGCATQSVFNILNSTGLVYSGAAENIGWVNATTDPLVAAENIFNQWMNSAGHKANILNASFTKIGIGSWHTAAGQTWSGGGYALPNVFIGVQIFAGGPVPVTTTSTSTTTTVPPSPPMGAGFHPVTPSRILDTRSGNGAPAAPLGAGATMNLQVTGRGGVPSTGVSAVVLNVAVTGPSAASWLTAFPAGEARPMAANLNYSPGETLADMVTAKLGAYGQVSLYNALGTVDVVADVNGWYDTGNDAGAGGFHSLTPTRILDTRTGNGAPAAALTGGPLNLQVAGRGGVPSTGVSAVAFNLAVTGPTAASWVTAYPAGEPLPMASNLNFAPGQTVSNLVTVKLGANGQVSLYNGAGATHLVADIAGWYDTGNNSTGARFHPLSPSRILDTRVGNGAPVAPLAGTMNLQVTGRGGVPSTAVSAVAVTLTVTGGTASSWLNAFPAGEAVPLTANVNFVAGETISNLAAAKLGTNGQLSLYNAIGTTHVIADVAGWFGG